MLRSGSLRLFLCIGFCLLRFIYPSLPVLLLRLSKLGVIEGSIGTKSPASNRKIVDQGFPQLSGGQQGETHSKFNHYYCCSDASRPVPRQRAWWKLWHRRRQRLVLGVGSWHSLRGWSIL